MIWPLSEMFGAGFMVFLQQHAASVQSDTTSDVSKLEMRNSKHNNFIGLLGFSVEFSDARGGPNSVRCRSDFLPLSLRLELLPG